MIRNIVFYVGIYVVIPIIIKIIYGLFLWLKYASDNLILDKTQIMLIVQHRMSHNTIFLTLISAIVTLCIYFLVLKKKDNNLFVRSGFKSIHKSNIIMVLFMFIGLAAIISGFVYYVEKYFTSYEKVEKVIGVTANTSIIAALAITILLPLFEEILFRGLIFYELKTTVNIVLAIIIQGAIFGILHMNILQGIYTFILGVALAIVYNFTKSIWASIIGHILNNILGVFIFPKLMMYAHEFVYIYIYIGLILVLISSIIMYRKDLVSKKKNFIV